MNLIYNKHQSYVICENWWFGIIVFYLRCYFIIIEFLLLFFYIFVSPLGNGEANKTFSQRQKEPGAAKKDRFKKKLGMAFLMHSGYFAIPAISVEMSPQKTAIRAPDLCKQKICYFRYIPCKCHANNVIAIQIFVHFQLHLEFIYCVKRKRP